VPEILGDGRQETANGRRQTKRQTANKAADGKRQTADGRKKANVSLFTPHRLTPSQPQHLLKSRIARLTQWNLGSVFQYRYIAFFLIWVDTGDLLNVYDE
jgi:hypothetical protein